MSSKGLSKKQTVSEPQREVQGQTLSTQDRFWLENVKNLTSTSITAIEDGAKQIISLVTLLQGIFFAVLTVSDLKTKLAELIGTNLFWYLLVLILIPLGCWITSLWLSVLVFLPKAYSVNLSSPDLSRETFIKIVEYKHKRLLQAYTALISGFIPLIATIITYLIF
jgi:hypothetical protein